MVAKRCINRAIIAPVRILELPGPAVDWTPADRRRAPVKDLKLAPAWMHPILRNLAEE